MGSAQLVGHLRLSAGDEVVQLYIRDDVGSVTRPVLELRGFRRVHVRPGETMNVAFTIDVQDLAFYNVALARVAEPGTFTVFVGGSSAETSRLGFRLETVDDRPIRIPATCKALSS